jgi:hypothetical protein
MAKRVSEIGRRASSQRLGAPRVAAGDLYFRMTARFVEHGRATPRDARRTHGPMTGTDANLR